MKNSILLTLKRVMLLSIVTVLPMHTSLATEHQTLLSHPTDQAIKLDGKAESAWAQATPLTLRLNLTPYQPAQYEGIQATRYSIRSLYDAQSIYFFIQWQDPTKSLSRYPWEKQPDGSWKQLKNPDQTGHENTYYEDKAALYWNINAKGFQKKGCDIACHMADAEGKVAGIQQTSAGRKFTRRAGETIDMWHWKAVRTGLTQQFDDQFVDATKDPAANKNWGRKGDTSTGGGYRININTDGSAPAFGNRPLNDQDYYAILEQSAAPFSNEHFQPGDRVPGILVAPFTGSRGDIRAQSRWQDGQWSLELKRPLTTSGADSATQDVQFSDLSQPYYFGVSIFDNSQINHLYHEGALKLEFR